MGTIKASSQGNPEKYIRGLVLAGGGHSVEGMLLNKSLIPSIMTLCPPHLQVH
jgi:hypothetical protein